MPKRKQTGYEVRTDFATFTTDTLNVFEEFERTGDVRLEFKTRSQANALRVKLYRTRLMMIEAAKNGDELAQRLYQSVQYMYIESRPKDEGRRGPDDPWTMRIIVDPITTIRQGSDVLPWKREVSFRGLKGG